MLPSNLSLPFIKYAEADISREKSGQKKDTLNSNFCPGTKNDIQEG
jgi:hypothetical protein